MSNLKLNKTNNYTLQNYTGEWNDIKFNFRVSKDGKGQIHRLELMDWDGKEIPGLSIDDVFELYKEQCNETPQWVWVNKFLLDDRLKKHNNSLWYI